jgi:hypothetical protein
MAIHQRLYAYLDYRAANASEGWALPAKVRLASTIGGATRAKVGQFFLDQTSGTS